MKRARFVAEARLEFLAEVIYYNDAEPGLGERFASAVEEAVLGQPGIVIDGES